MAAKLVIACITYNHENYISQALESFVQQKTNFPFEIIVSDDCSTDKTQEIISSYAEKYPDLIKPILRKKNVGIWQNWIEMAAQIKSQYVALCEGDDYWCDDYKLQKQVDFLDQSESFSLIFHSIKVIWENNEYNDSFFPEPFLRFNKTELDINDLLKQNFIQTNSVVYRWRFVYDDIYQFLPKNVIPIDYLIHLFHAQKGKIYYLDECMGVYRKHCGGVWFGVGRNVQWYKKCALGYITFYLTLEQYFSVDCQKKIQDLAVNTLIHFCNEKLTGNINDFKNIFPKLYNDTLLNIIAAEKNKEEYKKFLFYKILSPINKKYKSKYEKLKFIINGRKNVIIYTNNIQKI